MTTNSKTAIIIGATLSGLIAAKTIAGQFDKLILIDGNAKESLSKAERQHVSSLELLTHVHLSFESPVCGFICNAGGNITGVSVKSVHSGLEIIRADIVIDASSMDSNTPSFLQCLGYDEVAYAEKSIVVTSPYTQTVTIQSHNYHKVSSLPGGLFVIGSAVTNIAHLAGREDNLATIQAIILKKYLASNTSNGKFQKNIANIVSIVIQEYIQLAQQRIRVEHHLETRGRTVARASY